MYFNPKLPVKATGTLLVVRQLVCARCLCPGAGQRGEKHGAAWKAGTRLWALSIQRARRPLLDPLPAWQGRGLPPDSSVHRHELSCQPECSHGAPAGAVCFLKPPSKHTLTRTPPHTLTCTPTLLHTHSHAPNIHTYTYMHLNTHTHPDTHVHIHTLDTHAP